MKIYKVLKAFPSRNGVTEYKVGETLRVADNTRTQGLVRMKYLALTSIESRDNNEPSAEDLVWMEDNK